MVMPAFGSYTGGLNIREEPFTSLLPHPRVGLLGETRIFHVNPAHLIDEPGSMARVSRLA